MVHSWEIVNQRKTVKNCKFSKNCKLRKIENFSKNEIILFKNYFVIVKHVLILKFRDTNICFIREELRIILTTPQLILNI